MTRIAQSLLTLGSEVHSRSPLTTLYYYDDTPQRDSDHDPNPQGVVCGLDIMQGHGLDLHGLSREIVARRHPECAYVIFNKQIASRNTGWAWVDYHGASDHSDHVHVSVGVGPDGYKKPPYDSTASWLGEDMTPAEFLKLLQDPKVKAYFQAVAWQYIGGGIPQGMSTLGVLNDTYEGATRTFPAADVVLTPEDRAEIARLVAEELRGWSFLPKPPEGQA